MAALDDERIAELLAIFGPADFSLVLDAFVGEVEQAVIGLGRLMSDQRDRVRDQQLDYLIGAARNMGASGFADLCAAHEGAVRFGVSDHEALRRALRETCNALTDVVRAARSDAA